MRQSLVIGALASLVLVGAARAQGPADRTSALADVLTPEKVVRLHFVGGRTAAGSVLSVTDSTVAVGACMRCSHAIYWRTDIAGVDTMVGHAVHAPRVVAGAFAGGIIAAGAYVGVAGRGTSGCHDGPCGLWVLGVPPTFVAGALVGGVIGAFHPYIHWDPVALPPAS